MQSAESGKKRKSWQRRRENKSPGKQYQENSKKAEVSETEKVEDTSFFGRRCIKSVRRNSVCDSLGKRMPAGWTLKMRSAQTPFGAWAIMKKFILFAV